jgi:hypothetical protein
MADIIQDVLFRVKTDATEARNGVAKVADEAEAATTKTNKLSSAFKGLLPAIGVASVVAGITKIAKTSIDAAAKAEGIEQAFRRFGNSGLLDELRLKTKNLVSEVELQKQAVKFEQFNLPLEDLGNLLGFAAQRAQDTGESVDFLTNSIVVGLARKSLPILDNLGLNTKEIAEEAEKAGDFFKGVGTIVSREMAKAEGATETYSQVVQKLQVKWDNAQVALGKFLLTSVGLMKEQQTEQEILKDVNSQLNLNLEVLKKDTLGKAARKKLIEETNARYGQYLPNLLTEKSTIEDIEKAQKASNKQLLFKIASLDFEEKRNKIIKDQASATNFLVGSQIDYNKKLEELNRIGATAGQIKAVEDLIKTQEEQAEAIDFISENTQSALDEVEAYYRKFAESLGGTLGDLFGDSGKQSGKDFANGIAEGAEEEAKKVDMAKVARELELKFIEDLQKLLEDDAPELQNALLIALGIDTEESIKNIKDFLADPNNKEVIDEVDFLIPIKVDGVAMANSIVDVVKSVDGLIDAIGIGDRAQKEIDKLDELISKQDELVSKSKNLAEKGNADQLALEEARLDNLNKMREEEEQKKQKSESAALAFKKSISIAEIAINLARELSAISVAAAGLAATNPTPVGIAASVAYKTGATIKAVVLSALQAAAVLASGFSEGGYTGDGQKNDVAGTVHKGEFVIDKKTTSKLGLKSKSMDEVAEMFNSKKIGINGNGMLIDFAKVNDSMKLSTDINKLVDINKKMLRTMQSNGMNVNINEDGFALRTSKMIQMQSIYNAI